MVHGHLPERAQHPVRGFSRGPGDPLPELEVQYADYAVWQRQLIEGERLQQQAEYWKGALAGAPALLELPWDHARPAQQNYSGGLSPIELEETLLIGLKELSRRHGATLFMTLLGGWAALMGRLSGQEEVVIGIPVANRGRVEIEKLIGFFREHVGRASECFRGTEGGGTAGGGEEACTVGAKRIRTFRSSG